jgi:maltooligosyltrehalose trehalohydrolase
MLFQGEEWAASSPFQYFTDHQEPELARAVTEGRRREFAAFGWDPSDIPDPQDPATFQRSKLDWAEPAREPHRTILKWHRQLIELRARTAPVRDGIMERVQVAYDEQERWMVITRAPVTVAFNLAERGQTVAIGSTQSRRLLMASDGVAVKSDAVELAPDAIAILGPA